jgi:hypothetical protein
MAAVYVDPTTKLPATGSVAGAIQFGPDVVAAGSTNVWNQSRGGAQQGTVSDGMSKTILVCETREKGYNSWIDGTVGWVTALQVPVAAVPTMVNGQWAVSSTALSLTVDQPYMTAAGFGTGSRIARQRQFGPSSDHQGGIIIAAFGDTHVQQITGDIDPSVFCALSSRGGNESNGMLTE